MTVLDYSNWRPAYLPAEVVGVVRYIAPRAWGWPKAITKSELADLLHAGKSVAFNFEMNPNDYQAGFEGGHKNGMAIKTAMDELGMPIEVPVFVSYDTYVPRGAFLTCEEYHRGVITGVIGRPIDAYGENDLIEYLANKGLVDRGWMANAKAWPGNSTPTAHTVLQQYYGRQLPNLPGAYDVNDIVNADWGQYPRPTTKPKPPAIHEIDMENDMLAIEVNGNNTDKFIGVTLKKSTKEVKTVGGAGCVPSPAALMTNPNPVLDAYKVANASDGNAQFCVVLTDFDKYTFKVKSPGT